MVVDYGNLFWLVLHNAETSDSEITFAVIARMVLYKQISMSRQLDWLFPEKNKTSLIVAQDTGCRSTYSL